MTTRCPSAVFEKLNAESAQHTLQIHNLVIDSKVDLHFQLKDGEDMVLDGSI